MSKNTVLSGIDPKLRTWSVCLQNHIKVTVYCLGSHGRFCTFLYFNNWFEAMNALERILDIYLMKKVNYLLM